MPTTTLFATRFNNVSDALAKAEINFNSDTFKVALFLTTAPDPTKTNYSDISATEIVAGGGYTSGGATVSGVSATNTAGREAIVGGAVSWTASGDGIQFRYLVFYDSTSGTLIEWWDTNQIFTLSGANADTFTFTPQGGMFAIT